MLDNQIHVLDNQIHVHFEVLIWGDEKCYILHVSVLYSCVLGGVLGEKGFAILLFTKYGYFRIWELCRDCFFCSIYICYEVAFSL